MDDLSGRRLKSYDLLELIGAGGFGVVYSAYQESIDRHVAIKIIPPQYANNPRFVREFDREARLIARLEHPHIVPLYDFWRQPDGAYLVMRLLRGGNLGTSLARYGPLELNLVAQLTKQIASALQAAHHQGIVHQDLKPENILLDETSNAYLADFGIAKDVFQSVSEGEQESMQGSPAYMAPERLEGRPTTLKSDIYSFGLLLYAMLVGESPFHDESILSAMLKNLRDPVPLLDDHRHDLPPELNVVIQRATAKNPSDRYSNIVRLYGDFAAAMLRYSQSQSRSTSTQPIPSALATGEIAIAASTLILSKELSGRNPYKGLRAFDEADADYFFGREQLIDRIIEKFGSQPSEDGSYDSFLAIVGSSGSGKSSAIKAGLIPALRQNRIEGSRQWFIVSMVPGAEPLVQLEQTLLQIATDLPEKSILEELRSSEYALDRIVRQIASEGSDHILLFIDQFEETFALVESEAERTLFLSNIHNAVIATDSPLRIIIALRADFYDRPLAYLGFSDLMRKRTEVITPLTPADLEDAILRPALRSGLTVDRELVKAIINDLSGQPGALPLLQFALAELYDRRDESHLTLESYQELGGISSALAQRADELFRELDADEQHYARQLFLRLIAFDEHSGNTRQRVLQPNLLMMSENPELAERILNYFGTHRLLTFDHDPVTRTPTVEIAHESLIANWGLLTNWLDESREARRLYRKLRDAKEEWDRNNQDESFLARGSQLAQFEELPGNPDLVLTAAEHDYIQASTRLRQRTTNRIKLVMATLLILAIGAMGMAAFAFVQQNVALDAKSAAEAERDRADEEARIARSRELAMSAITQRERLDNSLLISIEALNVSNTVEARRSLLINLLSHPMLETFLHGPSSIARSVAYSPDGKLIAAGFDDHTIIIWDAASRQPIGEPLNGHSDAVWKLSFSPDGQWLASAGHDGRVILWNIRAPQGGVVLDGHTDEVWDIAFSPDGHYLASANSDGSVLLWDLETNPPSSTRLEAHTDIVFSVAFSPDGKLLASGGYDSNIFLWNVGEEQPIAMFSAGKDNWVLALAFSPDGKMLASGGVKTDVILWDVAAKEMSSHFETGHSDWIRSLAYSADGSRLATGSLDNTIRLWEPSSLQPIGGPLIGHTDAVWDLSFSPDSRHLASASSDGSVILWDTDAQPALSTALDGHTEAVWDIAFSPDGCLLASAGGHPTSGEDNAIRIWRVGCSFGTRFGEQQALLEGHRGAVEAVDFAPDSALLASGSADGDVYLWNLASNEPVARTLTTMHSSVTDLQFSSDGQILAISDDTGAVAIWHLNGQEWEPQQEATTLHPPGINSLALSKDGKLLATGGRDNTIHLWDAKTLEPFGQILAAHTDEVEAVAFSPDGHMLASGSRDQSIILWDLEKFEPIGEPLTFHTNWVTSLAFNPDGSWLASGSRDGTTLLWDVQTRAPLGPPFLAGNNWVTSVQFNPDGTLLGSGSMDGSVILWDVNPESWKALACEIANRNLTPFEWQTEIGSADYHKTCPL